jgi:hypothetical protein
VEAGGTSERRRGAALSGVRAFSTGRSLRAGVSSGAPCDEEEEVAGDFIKRCETVRGSGAPVLFYLLQVLAPGWVAQIMLAATLEFY